MPMIKETVTITNKMGLHARPAAMFVRKAAAFQADIWVEKDGERVNGKSIMGLMMLAANHGCAITIEAVGSDEEQAVKALSLLVREGFHED